MPAVGPIIGAIGSIGGGMMQSNAAGNAANAQTQAGRDAINAQLAMFNQSRADTLPYQTTGVGALNLIASMYGLPTYAGSTGGAGGITVSGGDTTTQGRGGSHILDPKGFIGALAGKEGSGSRLSALVHGPLGGAAPDPFLDSMTRKTGATPMQFNISGGPVVQGGINALASASQSAQGAPNFSAFYQTPDFLVARDEGIQSLDRGAAARGGYMGGGADADKMRFASNLGTQAFGNFTNNLMRIAGLGGSANAQLNQLGSNTAGNIGNAYANMGNARASGYANQANAWGNALGGAADAFGDYYGRRSIAQSAGYGGTTQYGAFGPGSYGWKGVSNG